MYIQLKSVLGFFLLWFMYEMKILLYQACLSMPFIVVGKIDTIYYVIFRFKQELRFSSVKLFVALYVTHGMSLGGGILSHHTAKSGVAATDVTLIVFFQPFPLALSQRHGKSSGRLTMFSV